jgi:hypothetical protein
MGIFHNRTDGLRNREEGSCLPPDFVATVLNFPARGPHAKANAAYAAQLLESDRREMRRAQIRDLLDFYRWEIEHRERLMKALRIEDQLLEAPSHV